MKWLNLKSQAKQLERSLFLVGLIAVMFPFATMAQQTGASANKRFISTKKTMQAAMNTHDKKKLVKAQYEMKEFINNDNKLIKKLAYYYAAYADYRLRLQFPDINKKQKEQYLNEGIKDLKKATAIDPSFADGQALLGTMYGLKIAGGAAGREYGPKSDEAMQQALKNGPDNPRVHLLNGIDLLNTPAQYGGGAERAVKQLEKSVQLFEKNHPENMLMPDWGHDEAYAWLGQAYAKNGQLKKARTAYQHALKVNPDYGWVKYSLLPALKKKM